MQHPTPEFLRHPMFKSILRWIGMTEIPENIPLAATLAAMDHGGVSLGMLSAWSGPDGTPITNDMVGGIVSENPERFAGLAAVDIRRPMPAVRELRRAVKELGLCGLRILPWWWQTPPTDRRFYPLYAECVELEVPLCLQVGHTGPLMPSEYGRPIPYLDQVALDFPELVVVGGHIGYPWTVEMISLATKYPNVYIDTSAYKVSRYPPELVDFIRRHGSSKVLFGTNHPMITAADALSGLDELGLTAEQRQAFLSGNADRVFKLKTP